jgi:DNA-binding HxlR family transcriptional regulator
MQDASKQVPQPSSNAQRAVVLLLLEHPDGLASSELIIELDDLAPDMLADALAALADEGVIAGHEERVRVSRCVWHLDALSLICA